MAKKTPDQLAQYRTWQKFFYPVFQLHHTVVGVYGIENTLDGHIYVGMATTPMGKRRWPGHLDDLATEKHHCKHLQRAWFKYGHLVFRFRLLRDLTPLKQYLSEEQFDKEILRQEAAEARLHPNLYNSFLPDPDKRMPREAVVLAQKSLKKRKAEDPLFVAELSKKLSDANLKSWQDPDIRERRVEGTRRVSRTPQHRLKMSNVLTTPEVRRNRQEKEADPVFKQERRDKSTEGWVKRRKDEESDPELKKERKDRTSVRLSAASARPEVKKKRSENATRQNARQRELEAADDDLRWRNFWKRSDAIKAGKAKSKLRKQEEGTLCSSLKPLKK